MDHKLWSITEGFFLYCFYDMISLHYISGFPCNPGFPYENDGPCGILALASTLNRLGKNVTFLLGMMSS